VYLHMIAGAVRDMCRCVGIVFSCGLAVMAVPMPLQAAPKGHGQGRFHRRGRGNRCGAIHPQDLWPCDAAVSTGITQAAFSAPPPGWSASHGATAVR